MSSEMKTKKTLVCSTPLRALRSARFHHEFSPILNRKCMNSVKKLADNNKNIAKMNLSTNNESNTQKLTESTSDEEVPLETANLPLDDIFIPTRKIDLIYAEKNESSLNNVNGSENDSMNSSNNEQVVIPQQKLSFLHTPSLPKVKMVFVSSYDETVIKHFTEMNRTTNIDVIVVNEKKKIQVSMTEDYDEPMTNSSKERKLFLKDAKKTEAKKKITGEILQEDSLLIDSEVNIEKNEKSSKTKNEINVEENNSSVSISHVRCSSRKRIKPIHFWENKADLRKSNFGSDSTVETDKDGNLAVTDDNNKNIEKMNLSTNNQSNTQKLTESISDDEVPHETANLPIDDIFIPTRQIDLIHAEKNESSYNDVNGSENDSVNSSYNEQVVIPQQKLSFLHTPSLPKVKMVFVSSYDETVINHFTEINQTKTNIDVIVVNEEKKIQVSMTENDDVLVPKSPKKRKSSSKDAKKTEAKKKITGEILQEVSPLRDSEVNIEKNEKSSKTKKEINVEENNSSVSISRVRCSSRKRIKPVNFWENKAVERKSNSGSDSTVGTYKDGNDTVEDECFGSYPKQLKFLEKNSDISVGVIIENKMFMSGMVFIKPSGKKPKEYSKNHFMYFFVLNGTCLVQIDKSKKLLSVGESFFVPHGVPYTVKNVDRTLHLKLMYTKYLVGPRGPL